MERGRELRIRGMIVVDVMLGVQQLAGQFGMQWMHPDEFTIVGRYEASGLLILVQLELMTDELTLRLTIQCCKGNAEMFEAFCQAICERFAGNLEE